MCARLGEQERPAWKVESRVDPLFGDSRPRLLPLKTPAHHEMDHSEESALEFEDDALADPSYPSYAPALEF